MKPALWFLNFLISRDDSIKIYLILGNQFGNFMLRKFMVHKNNTALIVEEKKKLFNEFIE